MKNANAPGAVDLGTIDGEAGDGRQRAPVPVDGELGPARRDPETDEWTVRLGLTARYHARSDETIAVDLAPYQAEKLRDALDRQLDRMD